MIELREVDSSNVAKVGYDHESETLRIEFHPKRNGVVDTWDYSPVHVSVYEEMIEPACISVGKLLNQRVKCDPAIAQTRVEDAA